MYAAVSVSPPLAVFGAPPAAVIDGNAADVMSIRMKLYNMILY